MKYIHHTIRIFTGILFVVTFGAKIGFLPNLVNNASMFTPEGFAFVTAVKNTGYLFPVIGIVSLISGITFLFNRYVAIGAIIMIPITINFTLLHIFMGLHVESVFSLIFLREAIAFVFLALNLYMLYSERAKYVALFK